jgi:TetR/AcrR family transcriptional repressor of mexJK operon
METESRMQRKRRVILSAASSVFLKQGFDGTSMDEVATVAGVSKPTVYKHFKDKSGLFAAIVAATTNEVEGLVRNLASTLPESTRLEADLDEVGTRFLSALTEPNLLRLRRLVIANAERFPEVSRTWYDQGFARALATLAKCFQRLAERGVLRPGDPLLAANHFVGLLLWIPLNRAMFRGDELTMSSADIREQASAATQAFLRGYCNASPRRRR